MLFLMIFPKKYTFKMTKTYILVLLEEDELKINKQKGKKEHLEK